MDDARIQRLKDEAQRQLNAEERYMLVNPALIVVLCELALKKPARMTASCPDCGKSVGRWADQMAHCDSCSWRGPYPTMEVAR
jgi:predicted RNA-binding Zn-ribbon protein involved in translation (DUF1610 family)